LRLSGGLLFYFFEYLPGLRLFGGLLFYYFEYLHRFETLR